jgi:hypothetical protein
LNCAHASAENVCDYHYPHSSEWVVCFLWQGVLEQVLGFRFLLSPVQDKNNNRQQYGDDVYHSVPDFFDKEELLPLQD